MADETSKSTGAETPLQPTGTGSAPAGTVTPPPPPGRKPIDVKAYLSDALSNLFGQTKESVAAFITSYTPLIVAVAQTQAVDPVAGDRMARHLRVQALTDAARLGIKLQQRSEAAFKELLMTAVGIALKGLATA